MPCKTHHQPPCFPVACLQIRPNSLIVFVPKFGIEGPVFLEDAEAAAAAAGRGQAPGSAVASSYIYDEDKQVRVRLVGAVRPLLLTFVVQPRSLLALVGLHLW